MTPQSVTVVGSVHMDLIATADRLPRRGETMPGRTFSMHPGGKGGNQAVQVALNRVQAFMVGRVGDDAFGERLRRALSQKGVDTTYLSIDPDAPTGVSTVLTGEGGDYASIIVPGASLRLGTEQLRSSRSAIASSNVLLTQLEIGPETVGDAVLMAKDMGKLVVLNAAPAPSDPTALPQSVWSAIDVLVVNQVEASMLSGRPGDDPEAAGTAGQELSRRFGIPSIVVTVGRAGAVLVTRQGAMRYPGIPVEVVDTIGAGDAFAGTLASELARGGQLETAVRFATAAGALAVTKSGAYEALPTVDEVHRLAGRWAS